MTQLEKQETERVANKLADAVHEMNKLNNEQIEYLDLLFQKLFIQQDIERILPKEKKKASK